MVTPSIQSFYQKKAPSFPPKPQGPGPNGSNDEPNPAKADVTPPLLTQTWQPKGAYEPVQISELHQGPGKVRFIGRLVNFVSDDGGKDGGPRRPRVLGFHFLAVKDDTGVVVIKLTAAGVDVNDIQLGSLVTVWTGFVAESSNALPLRAPFGAMMIPVHLSPASQSCIRFHREEPGSDESWLCRLPLNYDSASGSLESSPMSAFMNLRAYLNGGHDGAPSPRVVVCVSSVGPCKTVWSVKAQRDLKMVEVHVVDETDSCVLRLWEDKVLSARAWYPDDTILLISNPLFRLTGKKNDIPELGIGSTSMIEVDPVFPDADWLRRMAANRTRKESVYIPFPSDIWGADKGIGGLESDSGTLFTLADVDVWARDETNLIFTGKLNMVILVVRITEIAGRGMLCCFECCGVPIYGNQTRTTCKNCRSECELALNPRIIGPLADETGSIAAGKLIWSDRAWTELFFGSTVVPNDGGAAGKEKQGPKEAWKELTALDSGRLRMVEDQLQYSRVTLTFGWFQGLARLCVLGVEW